MNHTVGVRDNTELIESRLMCIKEVKLLDYLEHYMGEISDMFRVYAVAHFENIHPGCEEAMCSTKPRCYLRDAVADTYVSKGYKLYFVINALPYAKKS